jgi:exopolysaccharide biosynthesis polyprenyl glycosylphosphotransferase
MTPQVAARLTIHEDAEAITLPRRRRRLALAAEAPAAEAPAVLPADDVPGVDLDVAVLPSVLSREALHRRLLGLADMLAATLALVVVLNLLGEDRVALVTLAGMPLLLVLFKVAGLYDRDELRIVHSTLDEAPLLLQLSGIFALGVAMLQPFMLAGSLSGEQIGALWFAAFAAIAGGRVVARSVAGHLSPLERCLVIGEVAQVERIRHKLAATNAGARVVASLPLAGEDFDAGLGSPSVVRRVVRDLEVHRIIIAPTTTDANDVVSLIRMAKAVGVRVSVLPRIFEVVGSAVEFDNVDGMTMLGIRRFGLARSSRLLKRAFDVVATSVGLVVIGPLIAAIALAIRLDSKGPIFFRQVRVGRDGEHFRIFKFRSMVADADAQKEALRSLNEAGDGLFKIADDPRVTRVGCFLRRTSLDELPQVFNVLRGEMSLVGPRPLVVDEDAQVLGLDRSRLHLTPGMTGPWQVLGSRVPIQEMVGIDYLYVANWSLWLDLKLLLRTARHVVRGRNV